MGKSNVVATVLFAVLTVILFVMSFMQSKNLQKEKNKRDGAAATENQAAIKSIEEDQLAPRREELLKITEARDQVRTEYYLKNREASTLRHKLVVYQLVREKTVFLKGRWQNESVLFTTNRKDTEEAKKAELIKFQAKIDVLNSEIARDGASYEEKKSLISAQRKSLSDKIPLIEDKINKEKNFKETVIARTREDLRKFVLKSASTYDIAPKNGVILTSNSINNTAVISIGKKDGVRRGMKFDIIRENANKDLTIKGQFKVNEITDTTASGYIIDLTDSLNPILPQDSVGNPLFIKFNEAITTGEIINEKAGPNQILINRGSSHNVTIGQEFEVYVENQGSERLIKANCKVTEVKENTSICTLFNILKTNIFKEDKIGTHINHDLVKTFFLAGDFKKKFSNKDQVKAKIVGFGHKVVDVLTPTTNYLIEGTEGAEALVRTARELNVTVMQEDDILRYLD
jgi:hypothetical protein